eukprot:2894391-Pyramimonas_sp.AAC.1
MLFDRARTACENTGRHWPCTRGRIYFKKGTTGEIIWQVRNCFEREYNMGNTDLPVNAKFHVECAPWKTPHVQQAGKCRSCFAEVKKTTGTVRTGEPGPPNSYMVRCSVCRRAAAAFRGPWAATISDSRCGERFAVVQFAYVVVSSVYLPTVRRGDDRLD